MSRNTATLVPLSCSIIAVSASEGARQTGVADQRVEFLRDIQPILQQHCYQCHGPSTQMNHLRLDSKRAVLDGGASGPTLVPGRGNESLLYRMISGAADGPRMPFQREKLSQIHIDFIRLWID